MQRRLGELKGDHCFSLSLVFLPRWHVSAEKCVSFVVRFFPDLFLHNCGCLKPQVLPCAYSWAFSNCFVLFQEKNFVSGKCLPQYPSCRFARWAPRASTPGVASVDLSVCRTGLRSERSWSAFLAAAASFFTGVICLVPGPGCLPHCPPSNPGPINPQQFALSRDSLLNTVHSSYTYTPTLCLHKDIFSFSKEAS